MRGRSSVALNRSLAAVAVLALTAVGVCPTQASAPTISARVTNTAAHGGRVIVVLENQFPQLAVKKNGALRVSTTRSYQRSILADMAAHGATDIRQLVSVNAIAGRLSASEVDRLRANPAVASIQLDATVRPPAPASLPAANVNQQICPTNPAQPLLEPEALSLTHFRSQPAAADDAASIATGKGVKVGLTGINALAGNPNLIRPDGTHVVIDSPTPNADDDDFDGGGDEWYGDASSIAGQGTVTYDFSKELPFSTLPTGCTFTIQGIAPDVSLVDTGFYGQGNASSTGSGRRRPEFESQVIAGLDHAAIDDGVSVISESYGFGSVAGEVDFSAINVANDALVAAGITVVESSGDSGVGGTVEVPAYDPLVIDAGATTALRLLAQAWGYQGWESNQIAALSSGGTTPTNSVVDLVAPGLGGEVSCSPKAATCPQTTLTEAFGGTSESAPFVAGAAADVIQAYADSHGGTQPTPALVKALLTGTAQDLGASSEDQGSGLLDVYAAVRAAQQAPGSTLSTSTTALIPTPTQVNVVGNGGTTTAKSVTLYNASGSPATVTGRIAAMGTTRALGATVTENVSAPPSSQPLPAQGAQAAKTVPLSVPAGVAQLGVDMITPDPHNDAVLSLLLFDPAGRLAQVSYDYSSTPTGPVSNNENVAIDNPMPGTWQAEIVWNNGRSHLQDPPPAPGAYRGAVSVRATTQTVLPNAVTRPITIAAHSSATVPLTIKLPAVPGDHPESVRFTSNQGAVTTVPITRRTLIPAAGGTFTTTLGSSVARNSGPLKTFQIVVPPGHTNLQVVFNTADASADNVIDYFLVEPNGVSSFNAQTPSTTGFGHRSTNPKGYAAFAIAHPPKGLWTVQVMLDLTTSGKEFTQTVHGSFTFDAPATAQK